MLLTCFFDYLSVGNWHSGKGNDVSPLDAVHSSTGHSMPRWFWRRISGACVLCSCERICGLLVDERIIKFLSFRPVPHLLLHIVARFDPPHHYPKKTLSLPCYGI